MLRMHRGILRAVVAAGLAAASAHGASAQTGFSFDIAGIFLVRDPGTDTTMFRETDPNQEPILQSSMMDLLSSAGVVATLTAGVPVVGIELRGIFTRPGTSDWFENADPAGLGIAFGTADLFGIFNAATTLDLYAERMSTFRSLEANLRLGIDMVGFFAGVRQIVVTDHLQLIMDATPSNLPGSTNTADIHVRNTLLGPQIGAELNVTLFDRLSFNPFIKFGMLRNEMSADFALAGTGNFGLNTAWSDNRSEWTAVTEFGLDLTLNVTRNLGIFAGASLLRIAQMGSSTQSLPNLDLGAGTGETGDEPVFYAGARLGLRLSF